MALGMVWCVWKTFSYWASVKPRDCRVGQVGGMGLQWEGCVAEGVGLQWEGCGAGVRGVCGWRGGATVGGVCG